MISDSLQSLLYRRELIANISTTHLLVYHVGVGQGRTSCCCCAQPGMIQTALGTEPLQNEHFSSPTSSVSQTV